MAYEETQIEDDEFSDGETDETDNEEESEEAGKKGSGKILIAEMIILVFIAGSADLAEAAAFISAAVLVVGWVTWAIGLFFGVIASTVIFLWAFLRDARGQMMVAKKVIAIGLTGVLDTALGGAAPLRTIGLIIAIVLHNSADKLEKITKIVPGAAKKVFKK